MFCKKRFFGLFVTVIVFVLTVAGSPLAAQSTQTGEEKGSFYRDYIAKLAVNLGVEKGKVEAALQATKKQVFSEAVKQGRLTKDQADQLLLSSNPFWFGQTNIKKMGGKEAGRYLHSDMAKVLGIPAEQLNSELKSGKKLTQIINERGLTKDQFRQKMLEMKKESLSKAFTDRKLTQEQVDRNMQRMEKKLNCLLSEE